uniref:Uncharacterized protein n=1 Tax=Octopus bimaculoides TaxID=37653 RepID=A0A0L8I4I5_OCTBM
MYIFKYIFKCASTMNHNTQSIYTINSHLFLVRIHYLYIFLYFLTQSLLHS